MTSFRASLWKEGARDLRSDFSTPSLHPQTLHHLCAASARIKTSPLDALYFAQIRPVRRAVSPYGLTHILQRAELNVWY